MKRSLSLFLSLVLLVSALVVPMTASAAEALFNWVTPTAAGAAPEYPCNLDKFAIANVGNRYNYVINLLKDITPKVYFESPKVSRNEVSSGNLSRLADNDLVKNSDIKISNQTFATDGTYQDGKLTAFANGYNPTDNFIFDKNRITTYADIVYDLVDYYSISQIQHFASNSKTYNITGIYQIYAAKTEDELFDQKSLLINYQITSGDITDQLTSQDFKFTDEDKQPTARYFAFRVLCPVAAIGNSDKADDIRIRELAVYGTKSDKIFDVKVNKALDNNIDIIYEDDTQCELVNAEVDKKVKFKLTNTYGADVTVKYGGDPVQKDDNGVYEIIVAKGKELDIIPSYSIGEYTKKEITPIFDAAQADNVALMIVPKLYNYYDGKRTEQLWSDSDNIQYLSDRDLKGGDVSFGFTFKKFENNEFGDNAYLNGYAPGVKFDFERGLDEDPFDAYVDLVYDLGRPTDINKFQHIASGDSALSMGVYQLYASDSATDLFDAKSLICNYQNFDIDNYFTGKRSQEIKFPTRTAQYVAIRCYMSIIKCDSNTGDDAKTKNYYYNCFRIGDIAIYGTKTNAVDYKVTEILAPKAPKNNQPVVKENVPNKENDLLTLDTFESINAYEDGVLKGTEKNITDPNKNLGKLNSQTYGHGDGHGDFNCGVKFYKSGVCQNGYSFNRSNTNGNIQFTVPATALKVYYDFTYDLGDYYNINSFGAYLYSGKDRRIQAYEVYISNDRASLYTGDPVAVYNNYYNTYGQKITFDKAKVGKYIGFRVLNPGTINDDDNTYVRLDELAAYGTKLVEPDENSQLRPVDCDSGSVFIFNQNGSSVYKKNGMTTDGVKEAKNEELRTSMRLSLGYECPVDENDKPQANKIVLKGGGTATIVERNIIAAVYDEGASYDDQTFKIDTAVENKKITTVTGNDLKNYFKVDVNDPNKVYCTLNVFNIKYNMIKDRRFVVRGRIVYKTDEGEYYCFYTPVFGDDEDEIVSAQNIYANLSGTKPEWFKDENAVAEN